mmetsp:Transcript_11603/g.11545  ORF Transcript_11603/g.11545 Transcript_11603/m.11545 type:complete len:101 (-) Transcript_11603:177-479(-)
MSFRKTTIGDLSLLCDRQRESPVKQPTSQARKTMKNRKNKLPNITKNLTTILEMINSKQEVSFTKTTKSSRGLHNGTSKRRSRYIGVLGNGTSWQVLINV